MKIKELLKEKLEQFRTKRIKRKVWKSLVQRYEEQLQTELMLEQWIIRRIRDGQVTRRKELGEKQQAIKEIQLFINFFKTQK